MRMISLLAKSRLRHYRSRTALTMSAVFLASLMLQGIFVSALGVLDANKQMVQEGDWHVRLSGLTREQIEMLRGHLEVETLTFTVTAGEVEYGRLNGYLTWSENVRDDRTDSVRAADAPDSEDTGVSSFVEGRLPRTADEISGPADFFERLGAEAEIGAQVTVPFRANGADGLGRIQERTFTICGLEPSIDVEELGIAETRVAYGAEVSEAFVREILPEQEILYTASVRLCGEEESGYEEMVERIKALAETLGVSKDDMFINESYLYMTLTPPMDAIMVVAFLALLVVVFSMMIIYSIYYVNIISDIQEIGRLKMLGASDRQIRVLFLREGSFTSLIAVPAGILVGTLIPCFALPSILDWVMQYNVISGAELDRPDMFSAPLTLFAAAVMFLAVFLALRKPVRIAAEVSPVTAVRFEETGGTKKNRRGFSQMSTGRLCLANLSRSRRRTLVTLMAMGLSFSLFMGMAGVLSSITPQDMADRKLNGAQFRIALDYEIVDRVYPENSLNHVQMQRLLGKDTVSQIEAMDGVEQVRKIGFMLARVEDAPEGNDLYYDGDTARVGWFRKDQMELFGEDLYMGDPDYDKMAAENGVILMGGEYMYQRAELPIGSTVHLTFYDGNREIPFTGKIMACADYGDAPEGQFLITEDTFRRLNVETDPTTSLFVDLKGSKLEPGYERRYEEIKEKLSALVGQQERLYLVSLDEELYISDMNVAVIRYPCYALLALIVFISLFSMINTMAVSITARKRELGMLQAVGLSQRQLVRMLSGEGVFYAVGALAIAFTVGNGLGLRLFRWAEENGFMSVSAYHYPLAETAALCAVVLVIQLAIVLVVKKNVKKESLTDRIRSGE